jgi:hypothetical protein
MSFLTQMSEKRGGRPPFRTQPIARQVPVGRAGRARGNGPRTGLPLMRRSTGGVVYRAVITATTDSHVTAEIACALGRLRRTGA